MSISENVWPLDTRINHYRIIKLRCYISERLWPDRTSGSRVMRGECRDPTFWFIMIIIWVRSYIIPIDIIKTCFIFHSEKKKTITNLFFAAAARSRCRRFLNQLPTCVGVSPVAWASSRFLVGFGYGSWRYHSRSRLRVRSLKQCVFCSPSQMVRGSGNFLRTRYLSTGPMQWGAEVEEREVDMADGEDGESVESTTSIGLPLGGANKCGYLRVVRGVSRPRGSALPATSPAVCHGSVWWICAARESRTVHCNVKSKKVRKNTINILYL